MTLKTPAQIATEHARLIANNHITVTATPEALAEFLRCAIEADRAQRDDTDADLLGGMFGDPVAQLDNLTIRSPRA